MSPEFSVMLVPEENSGKAPQSDTLPAVGTQGDTTTISDPQIVLRGQTTYFSTGRYQLQYKHPH